MRIKLYPKHNAVSDGFSADEVLNGIPWLYADIECQHCGKIQPVAATHYLGGPCVRCGEPTISHE